ncbi:hypothetical protein [Sphingomonas sp.]|uniref:hypothetical protein n=1 Tax=Sphingomonas sp. TaxID=28214 RepID=UPI0035A9962B
MAGGRVFLDGKVVLHHGDSRDVLKTLADNSVDSVVTDPPYALVSIVKRWGGDDVAPSKSTDAYQRASAGFMGQQWDTGETAFAVEFWCEVMRVLKPGGHVIAASGTTGEAAWREGFNAILIEREDQYAADIAARLNMAALGPEGRSFAIAKRKETARDAGPLFNEATA